MKNGIYLFVVLFFFASVVPSYAQFDLLDKVKDKVEERVDRNTDEAIDEGLDEVEEDVKNSDDGNSEEAEENDENAVDEKPSKKSSKKAANDNESTESDSELAETDEKPVKKESLKTYSKFDFIPGDKVVFYDDFTQDNIGDFPVNWNTNGSGEIMTTNLYPGNWFKITSQGYYIPDPFVELPENFTIQYDVIPQKSGTDDFYWNFGFVIYEGNPQDPNEGGAIPGTAGIKFSFTRNSHSFGNYADGSYIIDGAKDIENLIENEVMKMSFWIQKQRVRVYMGETKIFDIPRGMPANRKLNQIRFEIGDEGHPMVSNFRVAVGAPDMRNKLLTEGKLVTHGILFDVNSDKIKPESYGTLKEIAKVLQDNADVKVKIVGHTDSDGSDISNLELSKKRSASVKNTLTSEFGIDASRMVTDGKGESESISDNNTPAGKANNRRVEFIKM